ncbi:MAG: septum formation inhibitor Maf [Synechococcaceae cyanobacterium RL_1_2]|nr:septum formation inhibitor Maf [Synechococcaceae cyanobacterium RL_1_2]
MLSKIPPLILASASPARRQILNGAGIKHQVCPSDFDESLVTIAEPIALVETLAESKAKTVATQYPDGLIIGCDSILEIAGLIHGKPASPAQAIERWQSMRGKSGRIYTGHSLIDQRQQRILTKYAVTTVYFANITDQLIQDYIATTEALQCAGGFAIDGKGGLLIEKLEGCHTNVIGLSLPLFREMITTLNYNVASFWQ